MERPLLRAAIYALLVAAQCFVPASVDAQSVKVFAGPGAPRDGTGRPMVVPASSGTGSPCGHTGAIVGTALGAVVGGLLGRQIKHNQAAASLGVALGGALGAAIGADADRRQCELKKIAAKHQLDVSVERIPQELTQEVPSSSRQKTVGLSVTVKDTPAEFATGSNTLTAAASSYFSEIADTYVVSPDAMANATTPQQREDLQKLGQKIILLIGHTDDVGLSSTNASLWEQRARNVAQLFASRGVPISQVYYQGAGETLPLADNRSEEGRARNRRVEIIDLPDADALVAFLNNRLPRLQNYRTTEQTAEEQQTSQPAPPTKIAKSESANAEPQPRRERRRKVGSRASERAVTAAASPSHRTEPPSGLDNSRPSVLAGKSPKPKSTETPIKPRGTEFDFGGQSASTLAALDIGPARRERSFVLGATANASPRSGTALQSCTSDRPRVAYAVKALRDGGMLPYATKDYVPGLFDSSWADSVNGHLVALTHVAVLRDGGMPVGRPDLLVYRDYHPKAGVSAKADIHLRSKVNVYRGSRALLYRVFSRGAANVDCIDVLLPPDGGSSGPGSRINYHLHGESMTALFAPHIAR